MPNPVLTVDKRNERIRFKRDRPWGNSYELNQYVAKMSKGVAFISFSGGKDSVAMWLYMIECECYNTIIPVHYYYVPNLEIDREMISYYEKVFKTKIISMPSPNLLSDWSVGHLLTPMCFRTVKSLRDYIFPCMFDDWDKYQRDYWGLDYAHVGVGMRMHDGLNRRGVVMQHGGLKESEKKFMPIFDFTIADVLKLINEYDVNLPADYHIWGKSFDGLDYRFLKPLKDNYPQDYKKIREAYPLIDANILRYRTDRMPLILETNPDEYL